MYECAYCKLTMLTISVDRFYGLTIKPHLVNNKFRIVTPPAFTVNNSPRTLASLQGQDQSQDQQKLVQEPPPPPPLSNRT